MSVLACGGLVGQGPFLESLAIPQATVPVTDQGCLGPPFHCLASFGPHTAVQPPGGPPRAKQEVGTGFLPIPSWLP